MGFMMAMKLPVVFGGINSGVSFQSTDFSSYDLGGNLLSCRWLVAQSYDGILGLAYFSLFRTG